MAEDKAPYELESTIESLFAPCKDPKECDEFMTHLDMKRRLETELLTPINPSLLQETLKKLGFIKIGVEGSNYWMINFV